MEGLGGASAYHLAGQGATTRSTITHSPLVPASPLSSSSQALHSFTPLLSLSSLSPPWSSPLGVRFVSTKVIVMLRFFSSSSVRPDLWRCVVCVQHAKPTVSYGLTMASQAQATNPSANMHPVRPPPFSLGTPFHSLGWVFPTHPLSPPSFPPLLRSCLLTPVLRPLFSLARMRACIALRCVRSPG